MGHLRHLAEFVLYHSSHGPSTADATEPVWNGYPLTLACPCGVVFGRWVMREEMEMDCLCHRAYVFWERHKSDKEVRSLTKIISVVPLPVFLAALPVRYAASAEQVEILELTKPEDIRHASTLDRSIDNLSNKVTECVQRKLVPASECFCLYPQDLARVRNTYEDTLRQHADWNNKTVSYTLDGRTHAISLGGLRRQFQTTCPQGN